MFLPIFFEVGVCVGNFVKVSNYQFTDRVKLTREEKKVNYESHVFLGIWRSFNQEFYYYFFSEKSAISWRTYIIIYTKKRYSN